MSFRRSALLTLATLLGMGCGARPVPDPRCVEGWCALQAGSFSNYFSPGSIMSPRQDWSVSYPRYVRLTQPFEIGQTETTTVAYYQGLGRPLPATADPSLPITGLSWHEAAAYCNALSLAKGFERCYRCTTAAGDGQPSCESDARFAGQALYSCPGYRLPTVAEWIYAHRAGTHTFFYSGTPAVEDWFRTLDGPAPDGVAEAFDALADPIGWYAGNSGGRLHPPAGKRANRWGLFDMAGNATEWCHDWAFSPQYPAKHYPGHGKAPNASVAPDIDPVVEKSAVSKILGGGYAYPAAYLGYLGGGIPFKTERLPGTTVRCVRSLPDSGL